jgi:hypothetical protein
MSSREIVYAAAGASGPAIFVEDVFSTYLYTGTGAPLTINNGIDLAGKGGMTWIKTRNAGGWPHFLFDTVRGTGKSLSSNSTAAEITDANTLTSFNSNGFSLGNDSNGYGVNYSSSETYASWTFREQPKFFDIVTYTGDGTTNRQVTHNLGSVPGMLIIKRTDSTSNWFVLSRANNGGYEGMYLNTTGASLGNSGNAAGAGLFSTYFDPEEYWGASLTNINGATYVAYLFAHNAGGFGTAGTDNVISCGSYTGNGSSTGPVINLGYEPQYVLIKNASSAQDWLVYDSMRGAGSNNTVKLQPNTSNAEDTMGEPISFNATGFQPIGADSEINGNGNTIIYMAIRRPMKVPTTGTSVFSPVAYTGNATNRVLSTGFPVDMTIISDRNNSSSLVGYKQFLADRLQGNANAFATAYTDPWGGGWGNTYFNFQNNTGLNLSSISSGYLNNTSTPYVAWNFSRRPGFFDQVCSVGFVDGTLINHNLGVMPELIIAKTINSTSNWMGAVNEAGNIRNLSINTTQAGYLPGLTYSSYFNSTTINPTGILNGGGGSSKGSGVNVALYLFATCAGVSKVGSYTGNGGTQAIACGFTGGARFVLIKRTDSTGDWYIYDTARGMTLLTDPYLFMNTTAAESATLGSVTTTTGGFTVDASIIAAINTNAASYIFLAIA